MSEAGGVPDRALISLWARLPAGVQPPPKPANIGDDGSQLISQLSGLPWIHHRHVGSFGADRRSIGIGHNTSPEHLVGVGWEFGQPPIHLLGIDIERHTLYSG